jgi:hypothetical protein
VAAGTGVVRMLLVLLVLLLLVLSVLICWCVVLIVGRSVLVSAAFRL